VLSCGVSPFEVRVAAQGQRWNGGSTAFLGIRPLLRGGYRTIGLRNSLR